MAVATLFNHGTSGSSLKDFDKAEIINLFGNNAPNNGFNFITEGVGSIGNPTGRTLQGSTMTFSSGSRQPGLVQKALGTGVDHNVTQAIHFIENLVQTGNRPDAINMIGWSRGAVTCYRIAYELYRHTDQTIGRIPVNIFAVDPVAGGQSANKDVNARVLNENVKKVVSCIAIGENRKAFSPMTTDRDRLHILRPSTTAYLPLLFPGVHDTIAKYKSSAGRIVFALAYKFLLAEGTSMGALNMFDMTKDTVFKQYCRLVAGRGGTLGEHRQAGRFSKPDFAKPEKGVAKGQGFMKGLFTGGGRTGRNIAVPDTASDNYFYNAHHKKLFADLFPQTFDAFFGLGAPDRNRDLAWWNQWGTRIIGEAGSMKSLMGAADAEAVHDALFALAPAGSSVPFSTPTQVGYVGAFHLV